MKKPTLSIFPILVLILSTGVTTFLILPYLASSCVLPRLIKSLPISTKEVTITQMTPWHVRGRLHFKDKDTPIANIPRFSLRYSAGKLFQGQLDALIIEGATLHVSLKNGRFSLHGNFLEREVDKQDSTTPFSVPLALESLTLKNCILVLHTDNQTKDYLVIDAKAALIMELGSDKKYTFKKATGKILSGGAFPLDAGFSITSEGNTFSLTALATLPALPAKVQQWKKDITIHGNLKVDASASITTKPLTLENFKLTLQAKSFLLHWKNVVITNKDAGHPLLVTLEGNPSKANYQIQGLTVNSPVESTIQLKGTLKKDTSQLKTLGEMQLEILDSAPSNIGNAAQLVAVYSAELNTEEKNWQSSLSLHSANNEALHISHQHVTFSSQPIHLDIEGNKETTTLALLGKDFRFKAENFNVEIPSVNLTSRLNNAITPEQNSFSIQLSEVNLLNKNVQLKGFSFSSALPHSFEAPSNNLGTLRIQELHAAELQLGTLTTDTSLTQDGLAFSGNVTDSFLDEFQLHFSGKFDPAFHLSGEFSAAPTNISSEFLPTQFPLPDSLSFSGELELTGNFSLKKNVPSATLLATFSEGEVTLENKNLTLSGINLDIELPDLPKLQSSPSQSLTIASLDFGSFHLTDGRIHYRLDPMKTLFIEKSRFTWCGGKIESGSMQLSYETAEVDTTLYCDRLGFSELLTQFNVSGTEGEGSLNGKLPVKISKRGLNVDGGFLFSTPGKKGTIKFENTTMLRDNMPTIDAAGYLDYSLKALENFSYNWSKLTFSNKDDNLLLAMELDGKPSSPLPFAFNQGKIEPYTKGAGLQYPVRLNVNFLFPLKDMFEYGKNLKSVMDNM